jgi:protein-L-isoaspartate(D-aspartate) O-methyltransferase
MAGKDREPERLFMVQHHLRNRGISSELVLDAMSTVPRELFLPPEMLDNAYEDRALGIGRGQTISQPWIVAYMTQALELKSTDRVLEIGTGSGYQAAILSLLAREVYTIERLDELSKSACLLFETLGYDTIHTCIGDGTLGLPSHAPYDAIIITAASPGIPEPLVEQLAPGGRMILPLESDFNEVLTLVRKNATGLSSERLCECRFVPLIGRHGYERPPR